MKTLLYLINLISFIASAHADKDTIGSLKEWLSLAETNRSPIIENEFAITPISKEEAQIAKKILWEDHALSLIHI